MFGRAKPRKPARLVVIRDGLRSFGRQVNGLSHAWRRDADRIWQRAVKAERRVAVALHDGWEVVAPPARRMARSAKNRVRKARPYLAKAGRNAGKGAKRLFA